MKYILFYTRNIYEIAKSEFFFKVAAPPVFPLSLNMSVSPTYISELKKKKSPQTNKTHLN